jgi:hypothetical protein
MFDHRLYVQLPEDPYDDRLRFALSIVACILIGLLFVVWELLPSLILVVVACWLILGLRHERLPESRPYDQEIDGGA